MSFSPFGCLMSGFLLERIGRKKTLMMVNVPQLVAWAVFYFSSSVIHLFISVSLLGFTIGFIEATTGCYVGEVSQPRLRGIFTSLQGIFYNTGFMVEAILGAVLPWRIMILCNMAGPVIGLVALALLPESPAWLVTKGRVKDAERAYQWLRGWVPPEAVQEELNTLVCNFQDSQEKSNKNFQNVEDNTGKEGTCPKNPRNTWGILLEPEVQVAFRIIMISFILSTFVSLFGMRPFFIEILNNIDVPLEGHSIMAICGVMTLLGCITMGALIKLSGKRKLCFFSMSVSILYCVGLGVYLAAGLHSPWFPVGIFLLSYYFGAIMLQLPWVFVAELFPLRARSTGSGICAGFAYVVYFLVTKTYYDMTAWLDVYGTCLVSGAVGLLGLIYLYLDLPETEGHSLEEIERRLSEKKSFKKNTMVKNANKGQIKDDY